MSLANQIFNSPWCIDASYVKSSIPKIFKLAAGEKVDFNQHHISPYLLNSQNIKVESVHTTGKPTTTATEDKIVAIIPIRGVMMKDDQECGPQGMESILAHVKAIAKNEQVGAIVFDFDSPGGQASFLETFSNVIKSIDKPTLTSFNSLCASAAYYLASNTDEIYASESTDRVGSIGTMMSAMNFKGFFEKEGVDVFEIYADQSSDKNKQIRALFDRKDAGPLKQDILNPFAKNFINRVKTNRDINDKDVFRGNTYMSEEAIENGLIDGIKSFDQVIERAFELINADNDLSTSNTNSNINNMKKLPVLMALLGLQTEIQSQEGHVSLSDEHIALIESTLASAKEATTTHETTVSELEAANKKVTKIGVELATANTTIEENEARITELEDEDGAAAATTEPNPEEFAEGEDGSEPWNDPNSTHNQSADEMLAG